MTVKKQTEQELRLAMERLLSGNPTKTDGRLTQSNWAKEAAVSRATLHRAPALVVEFHNRRVQTEDTPERVVGSEERIRNLENKLAETIQSKNETIRGLQESHDILANQVQGLTLDNEQLREALQRAQVKIVPLTYEYRRELPWSPGQRTVGSTQGIQGIQDVPLSVRAGEEKREAAILRKIDCVLLRVDDLEAAVAYYQEVLGLRLHWRQALQAGLGFPETDAEIVLHCDPNIPPEASVHYLVDDVILAVQHLAAQGCTSLVEPFDIAIGQCAAAADPFGNTLYLLDMTKGPLPAGDGITTENATERPNQHEK